MIVGAFAASHGPLLSIPPEQWYLRAQFDHTNPAHYFRGEAMSFETLRERRRPGFEREMSDAEKTRRYDASQRAVADVARRFAACRADLAVIIGNDQAEVFSASLTPAFTGVRGGDIRERSVFGGPARDACAWTH